MDQFKYWDREQHTSEKRTSQSSDLIFPLPIILALNLMPTDTAASAGKTQLHTAAVME